MRKLGVIAIMAVGPTGAARADDAVDDATYGRQPEVGPTAAVDMTPVAAVNPCDELHFDFDVTGYTVSCTKLATSSLDATTAAVLYRLRASAGAVRSTRYVVVVTSGDERLASLPLEVYPNSKLGRQWTEPVDQQAKLRRLRVDGKPAIALDLRVINRANVTESSRSDTVGYRSWTRNAYVVCANHDGWRCVGASFGGWFYEPCTATLHDDGVVEHACMHREPVRF